MNITNYLGAILQGISIIILALGVTKLFSKSHCLTVLTTWKEEHGKQESEWHQENKEEHRALRDRLDQIANGRM
jgi:hypothetical protein